MAECEKLKSIILLVDQRDEGVKGLDLSGYGKPVHVHEVETWDETQHAILQGARKFGSKGWRGGLGGATLHQSPPGQPSTSDELHHMHPQAS